MPRTARPLSLLAALLLLVPASAPAHAVPAPAQAATTPDRRPTLPRPSIVCAPHCVGGSAMSARGVVYRGSGVPAPPRVRNVSWIAVDLETGEVLAAKAPHARLLPASTLKILTALTLLPVITPEKRYRAMPSDVQAEGTRVGILPGKTYSGRELYDALLLSSGNDAAYMLARVAGGRAKTLRAMNETARELGAFDTAAGDPSGLDAPGQRTSVYDLAREALTRRSGLQQQLGDLQTQHAQLQAEEEKLVRAHIAPETAVMGADTPMQLSQAEAEFQKRRRAWFLSQGVAMTAPETVFFSWDTEIAAGAGEFMGTVLASEFFGHEVVLTISPTATIPPFTLRQSSLDPPEVGARIRIDIAGDAQVLR